MTQTVPVQTVRVMFAGNPVSAPVDFERIFRRFLQDTLAAAIPSTWLRRAAQFEAARPRADDYRGLADDAALSEADRRCAATAMWCKRHADLLTDARDDWGSELTPSLRARQPLATTTPAPLAVADGTSPQEPTS